MRIHATLTCAECGTFYDQDEIACGSAVVPGRDSAITSHRRRCPEGHTHLTIWQYAADGTRSQIYPPSQKRQEEVA